MIGKVKRIVNNCLGTEIDLCSSSSKCYTGCNGYQVVSFKWRDRNRRNTKYDYDTISGGFSTCMRDEIKEIDLSIQIIDNDRFTRGYLRKELEKVVTNYDCCDNCCSITVYFEDDDGKEYYFDAKVGNQITQDEVSGHKIIQQLDFKLEMCGQNFFSASDEKSCCGVVGEISGFRIPYFCSENGSCITGSKFVTYEGTICEDYRIEIQADRLVNPIFHNITKKSYYGLVGSYSGELIIDTSKGVTINGNTILPMERKIGSSFKNMKFTPGVSEVLLTAEGGSATWCLYYGNNIA